MLLVAKVPIEPTVGQAGGRHHVRGFALAIPVRRIRPAAAATIASRVCAASKFDFLNARSFLTSP